MFNAKEYLQSIEKPTYIDVDKDGNEVKIAGKVARFNDVAELEDRLTTIRRGDGPSMDLNADLNALVEDACKQLEMEKAVPYICALPLIGRIGALEDFFLCLRLGRVQQNQPNQPS